MRITSLLFILAIFLFPLACSEDDTPADTASGDTSSGDTSSGDTSSGDTASGDTTSADTSSEDTSSADTSSADTSSADTSSGDTSSEDTSSGDTSSEDTSSADTSSADTSSADTSSEDVPPDEEGCRSSIECTGEDVCIDPNPHNVCGIGPSEGCYIDADCPPDFSCHVTLDSCSFDGFGAMCGPSCSSDEMCGGGLRCNVGGTCEAIPCDDPASIGCPSHQVCDSARVDLSGAVYDRHDGCFDIPCGDDSNCGDHLTCVNSRCQMGFGVCGELFLVP